MEVKNSVQPFDVEEPTSVKRKCRIRKMYFAAFTSLLMCLTMGLCTGYVAPATYDMTSRPDSVIQPTQKEIGWIGSIMFLGMIIGGSISGPLADKFGRQATLIYNLIPFVSGWLFICYAEKLSVLLIGRVLCGVAFGIGIVVVPIYCVEIATVEVRGILGSACQGFVVIGHLISVTVGAYISWSYLALHGAIVSILSVIAFGSMPQSPRWLLMKNDLKGAISAMNELQQGFIDAEKECKAIYDELSNKPKGNVSWKELKHPVVFKPALIILAILFIQIFSGVNAVFANSSNIFKISERFVDPKMATIIIAVVQVVATLISNLIVDRVGRKILLISSGILISLSFIVFGTYYYKLSVDSSFGLRYDWIPLSSVTVAVIGYSFGYGPIPFLLTAELFHVRVRGTVGGILNVINGIYIFTLINTFSDMEDLLTPYGTFWFYSIISVIGVVFVIIFVPETKGKPLEEIQNLFYENKNGETNV